MLHDIAVAAVFVAMLVAPCVITLRSQRTSEEIPPPTSPISRTR